MKQTQFKSKMSAWACRRRVWCGTFSMELCVSLSLVCH